MPKKQKPKRRDFSYYLNPKNYSVSSIVESNRRTYNEADEWDAKLFEPKNIEAELHHFYEFFHFYAGDTFLIEPETFRRVVWSYHICDLQIAEQLQSYVLELNRTKIMNYPLDFLKVTGKTEDPELLEPTGVPLDDRIEDDYVKRSVSFINETMLRINEINQKYDDFYLEKNMVFLRKGESDTVLLYTTRPKAALVSFDYMDPMDNNYLIIQTSAFHKNTLKISVFAKRAMNGVVKVSDFGMKRVLRIVVIVTED